MAADPPVDFEERAKRPKGATNADYPYAISSRDLMQNFVYATLDADPSLIEETSGMGGHKQRKLKIPELPGGGDPLQLTATGSDLSWAPGGIVREYFVAINGTLYREGFLCAQKDENDNTYPVEVT